MTVLFQETIIEVIQTGDLLSGLVGSEIRCTLTGDLLSGLVGREILIRCTLTGDLLSGLVGRVITPLFNSYCYNNNINFMYQYDYYNNYTP